MTFVCYPKCTTCQKARKWLDEKGISYELRDIKTQNPSYEELEQWYRRSGLPLKSFQYQRSALQIHGAKGQVAGHDGGRNATSAGNGRNAGEAPAAGGGGDGAGGLQGGRMGAAAESQ